MQIRKLFDTDCSSIAGAESERLSSDTKSRMTGHDRLRKPALAMEITLLGLSLLLSPLASAATTCPNGGAPPLSRIAPSLVPGARVAPGAFDTTGAADNPLSRFATAFRDQVTLATQALEVRGFVASDSDGGRAVVLFFNRTEDGLCIVNAWQSAAEPLFSQLSLISVWRSRDARHALFLVEASGDRRGVDARPVAFQSIVFASDGSHVSVVFESDLPGLAFDPRPDTVALLGAGEPLFYEQASGRLTVRPAANRGPATGDGTCPASGNKPLKFARSDAGYHRLSLDRWIADDTILSLYDDWPVDAGARVAFRKLLSVAGHTIEAVAVAGRDALLVFLAPQAKGFCVLNVVSWSWGGNGTSFNSIVWWHTEDWKRAVLLADIAFAYHHGATADDPRSEETAVALTLEGLQVKKATSAQETAARASRSKRR
jgi:hypothetical protein